MSDNSDYVLTADGAEYVEAKFPSDRLAVALLSQGTGETVQSASNVCPEPHPTDEVARGRSSPDAKPFRMN